MGKSWKIFSFLLLLVLVIIGQPHLNTVRGENIKKAKIKENLYGKDSTLTIVAFGNSITATRKTIDKVFAQRLPGLLLEKGIRANVINSGIGGSHTGHRSDHDLFKISHALDRFESDVLAYEPNLVIIGFGTNDAHIDSNKRGGKSRIPVDKYKINLKYMINQLLERNIKIILIAPNILGAKYGKIQNNRLLKYVKVVRRMSNKYNLGLVDNYKLFVNYQKETGESYERLMLDGVHPNDLGHKLIADKLAKGIVKICLKCNYEKK